MNQSEKTDQLDLALMAMHQEYGVIIGKDKRGHVASYATLPAILEWITPKAVKHGLKLSQSDQVINEIGYLVSEISHPKSGQYRRGCSHLVVDANAKSALQAWGGSTTYQRRYQAMMICGLFCADDETDNDGQDNDTNNNSGSISSKQLDLYLKLAAQYPDKASNIAKKYPDPAQIPWKAFQDVLAFMDPEKYKKQ